MQGFLTLPVKCGAPVADTTFVDLNLGPGIRDWQGGSHTGHEDNYATDYDMPDGQAIIAPAPGIIVEAENTWPNVDRDPNLGLWNDGNRIVIYHGDGLYTIYCNLSSTFYVQQRHLDMKCESCEKVKRGQIIALSDTTGANPGSPHVHFQFGGFGPNRIDPYRNLLDPNSVSYWTKDNDPQCLP
jgi:murein DD-endopeptidase MepM/ murein hydrolase activator NlpD